MNLEKCYSQVRASDDVKDSVFPLPYSQYVIWSFLLLQNRDFAVATLLATGYSVAFVLVSAGTIVVSIFLPGIHYLTDTCKNDLFKCLKCAICWKQNSKQLSYIWLVSWSVDWSVSGAKFLERSTFTVFYLLL